MDNTKTALSLNLSNQSNLSKSKKVQITQFNTCIIMGLEYLENRVKGEDVPISVVLKKDGELTINGLDRELVHDHNISIYSDKRVTNSSEDFEN